MPWYGGPTLLHLLESLPIDDAPQESSVRFFVQWVIRHNGSDPGAFRGYAGQLAGGTWRVGDAVRALPSDQAANIVRILRGDQEVQSAQIGDSVTVVLDRDIDVSRGDVLIDGQAQPRVTREFDAELCWLDQQALNPARLYWLKIGRAHV